MQDDDEISKTGLKGRKILLGVFSISGVPSYRRLLRRDEPMASRFQEA